MLEALDFMRVSRTFEQSSFTDSGKSKNKKKGTFQYCYRTKEECSNRPYFTSFLVSVMAGLVANLICKWFDDGKRNSNEPTVYVSRSLVEK